ncbi:hypothetical protein GN244_ATG01032 [Phytophthora infestans]|uniref:Uncharacterized protein n=1 Tax=Phytophthora infestans TaxID=4787 RepID=A0A833X2G2_PHYIN|nr:hypothetical protein GN244_ATG01032 [Phytophthora infestans]KAF4130115.1 hypothetical protein GN958_ATG20530 [Phytophthora infestans]
MERYHPMKSRERCKLIVSKIRFHVKKMMNCTTECSHSKQHDGALQFDGSDRALQADRDDGALEVDRDGGVLQAERALESGRDGGVLQVGRYDGAPQVDRDVGALHVDRYEEDFKISVLREERRGAAS